MKLLILLITPWIVYQSVRTVERYYPTGIRIEDGDTIRCMERRPVKETFKIYQLGNLRWDVYEYHQ